jgi:hypothetical protein
MFAANNNVYNCPPMEWFVAAVGYAPVTAFEANVGDNYGHVMVTPLGAPGADECSPPGTESGWSWDFWTPCQAHDYCYDMYRAGFEVTVTKGSCDVAFWYLMEANCNNRPDDFPFFEGSNCASVRDTYYAAVVEFGTVVGNPPVLRMRAVHSSKCLDVPNASPAFNIALIQYTCNGSIAQMFRMWQFSNGNASFRLGWQGASDRCVGVVPTFGWPVAQLSCWSTSANRVTFYIDEVPLRSNKYILRAVETAGSNWCVSVPGSSQLNGENLIEWPCTPTPNQHWYLQPA